MEKTNKILFLVIILKISAIYVTNANYYYCNLKNCPNPHTHTLCHYSPRAIDSICYRRLSSIGLNPQQKDEIVRLHNYYRSYVASGHETRGFPGPQPRAANMQNLIWDYELADIAQSWANRLCSNRISYDTCRDVARFKVGQNVAFTPVAHPSHLKVTDAIHRWYDEVKKFNNHCVNNYQSNAAYEHYIQLIWARTTYIGCGQITYKSDHSFYVQVLVCNYGPAGNVVGEQVYQPYWPQGY